MEGKNLMLYNVSFLFLAITVVLGTVQPASANISELDSCYVHVGWKDPSTSPTLIPLSSDESCPFDLYDISPSIECTGDNGDGLCQITIPNFEDPLDHKFIQLAITYEGLATIAEPTVTCFDPTLDGGQGPGTLFYVGQIPVPNGEEIVVYYEGTCEPNPDYEIIHIHLPSDVVFVDIWTKSFDDQPVGGTYIPIDQSALLLAGVQSVSMWMIPVVIAGIGVGVFVIKRRN